MKFKRRGNQSVEFVRINLFIAEIIRQIPASAYPDGNPEALSRIFSSPSPELDELARDWDEFVVPDLAEKFNRAVAQVQHDLAEYLCEVEGEEDFPFSLRIPVSHIDAWLSALNQARLVLAARHGFTDQELSEHFQRPLVSLRDLGLYQLTVYGWMQELLVTALSF